MFWNILILLFFIFTPKALANDISASFVSGANTGNLNTQFDVQIKVSASTAGTYYISANNGTSCTVDMLYNNSWSNGCYVGINAMQPFIINNDNGSDTETLRLRATGSSGTYNLSAYVYDVNRSLLSTSPTTYSVTINNTPTSTPTPTPTITPTPTLTPIITPTPTLTPIPTEEPTNEPTDTPEPTASPTPIDNLGAPSPQKSSIPLPIIFILLGLLLVGVPMFGPKILKKIKSKKKPPTFNQPKPIEAKSHQPPTPLEKMD
jgi:hypothetical protein